MDVEALLGPPDPAQDASAAWAASGAMALTGRASGPPRPAPSGVVDHLSRLAARLAELTAGLGRPVRVDGPALLGERAALLGLSRHGATSCGGAARLLAVADGWLAVSLPRPSDLELLPAWLGTDPHLDGRELWPAVAATVARLPAASLVADAAALGLAVGALGETSSGPVIEARPGPSGPTGARAPRGLLVVDLSSLWAGPLCGQLLAAAGLRVVKVESAERPDGARAGEPRFFDLLNGDKASVVLPFGQADGRRMLRRLLERADVVIEASRPRALDQLGIDRDDLKRRGPAVWLSITGHGTAQPVRVGFGDDAAVAGGLVGRDGDGPVFLADAAADPATGLLAAVAVLDRLQAGGTWHLDLALARTAAWLASGPVVPWTGPVAPPRARPPGRVAPPLGHDTRQVLADLGLD